MSVIQRIRDKGAWIIFGIIALALIAFILQDGVRRGGSTFSNTSTIGKVNGEKIERGDFQDKLAALEAQYGQQGAQRDQLIGSLWNQEVERLVLENEYKKLGLQVSSKELTDILFNENSPLRQQFTDPKTGVFMVDNAKQALAQLKKSKNAEQIKAVNNQLIVPAIAQSLRNKYQNILMQAAYVPKWFIEKQMADNNAIASVSYVYVPYASVSDSALKVSDEEISAYVSKHSKQYSKTDETRNISFVTFSGAPVAADSANALNLVLGLKNDFAAATDMEAFLNREKSELPYYNSYFSKAKMQQVNKDSLTRMAVGSVYGPYVDGSNFVLAKMIGTKQWPDSAKVRHILVGTMDPRSGQMIREDSTAKKLIDSIENAIKGGASFDAMVAKYSDDQGSKDKGGVYDYFEQGKMMLPFNDFAFDKSIGSKGVVKTDFGYHYMEVLGQKNPTPVYKIAYLAKPIIASNETLESARTAAAQFAVSGKDAKKFNATALSSHVPVLSANDIKENDFSVMGIGQNRQLVRWVYDHSAGDVSDPLEMGDNYIVAMVSAVNKAGLMSAAEARPTVESIVRNEKKAKQIIETKFKGNTLEAYASSTGTAVLRADSLAFSAPFIAGVGAEPKVVGAAFNKALAGKASAPIEGSTGVFAVKVESNGAKPGTGDVASVKQGLLQTAKMSSYRGLEALKKAANIKDYRAKFF
ncbi:MAG: peptidyl-prolyl cis-trans isomerase [Sediminibacterium sp.]|nr:peptidyl-prolyl cis-trans isomerase [Sediminibacterium sp.]